MSLLDGILAYWNLNDDGSGNVSLVDSTGHSNTLTNNNGVTLGTGIIAGDAVFYGTNYLNLYNGGPFAAGDFSVCLWVNPSDVANYRSIFGTDGFAINSNGSSGGIDVNNAHYASDISTTGNLSDGTWTNIVVTNISGIASLYVNSVFQASTTQEMSIGPNLKLGGVYSGSWYGQIDEVGVWNRALTTGEITDLYNSGFGLSYPFLPKLYYNNGQEDGDCGNILNWWQDPGFTIPATSLPASSNQIKLYGSVTQNSQGADQLFCYNTDFYSVGFAAGLTIQASGLVNLHGSSLFEGTCTSSVVLNGSSQLSATSIVNGNATLHNSSTAFGSILENATVYYDGGEGQFPIGGTVGGSVTYLGWPAKSPQWFNDQAAGASHDGDFNNPLNWWADNTYTTRPLNTKGRQELPDASTDVFIAPTAGITANSGTANPTVNSVTSNNSIVQNISITATNGFLFSGGGGAANSTLYGSVTFQDTAYNNHSVIQGTATYKSVASLQNSWGQNSLGNVNIGASVGSTGFAVNIAGGGTAKSNWISRLLHLPWFINL